MGDSEGGGRFIGGAIQIGGGGGVNNLDQILLKYSSMVLRCGFFFEPVTEQLPFFKDVARLWVFFEPVTEK